MTHVVPDHIGRAAHDSQRALPSSVALPLYRRLSDDLGSGIVLDVGAGSGIVAAQLARAGARVVLTDVVDWRSVDLPFVLGDAGALPFASGSASGVHLARVLHHVPDWRAVLREVTRVVAPTGVVCLSLGDRPVVDHLRSLVDRCVELALARGLRESAVAALDQAAATAFLAELGWRNAGAFEFGADVAVTPRQALTASLANPFRWEPGQDLGVLPDLVAQVLTATGIDPDTPVLRDRTVRYVTYRRVRPAGHSVVSFW